MELAEFARIINIKSLSQPEQIIHFGWYLHVHRDMPWFHQAAIRSCYEALSIEQPNLSLLFKRLVERKPQVLRQGKDGFQLEHSTRARLDSKYGLHETTIALSRLMKELPGLISDQAEKLFLSEAIICYHNRAFRASVVMMWNLTYDHLLNWILKDPARLAAFRSKIEPRVGARRASSIDINKREDFEDLKESETIDIAGSAGLYPSDNTKKILEIQLTKRNMAAHPSLVVIAAPEAEETISTLINNVVLILK